MDRVFFPSSCSYIFLFFFFYLGPPFLMFHENDGERMFVRSVSDTKPTAVQYLARKGLADVSDVEREGRKCEK